MTVRGNTLYPTSHLDLPLRPFDTQLILERIAAIDQRFEEHRRAIAAVHEPFDTEQRTLRTEDASRVLISGVKAPAISRKPTVQPEIA